MPPPKMLELLLKEIKEVAHQRDIQMSEPMAATQIEAPNLNDLESYFNMPRAPGQVEFFDR